MEYSTDLSFLALAVVGKRTLPRYADALLDVYGEWVQPPHTRTPQLSPYPEVRFDTTPGTLECDYTIMGGTGTHGSRQIADGQ